MLLPFLLKDVEYTFSTSPVFFTHVLVSCRQGHSISKVQDSVHRPLRNAEDLGNEEPVPRAGLNRWMAVGWFGRCSLSVLYWNLEGTCFFLQNMCYILIKLGIFKMKEEVEIMQQKSSDICQWMEKRRQKRHVHCSNIRHPWSLGKVHGTFLHSWLKIRNEGLKTMGRNHIHMCHSAHLVMENMDFVWMIRGLHGMILLESVCSIDPNSRMFVRVFIVYRCLTFNMYMNMIYDSIACHFDCESNRPVVSPFFLVVWPNVSTGQKRNTKKLNRPVCGGINHWMFLGFLDALEIQSPSKNGNGT